MARITVEDCLARIPNRFELVVVASQRAKDLLKGSLPLFLQVVTQSFCFQDRLGLLLLD